jgi:hypothetical protein
MYCLDTINLTGNPVVNQCPEIGKITNDADAMNDALNKYFGGGGGSTSAFASAKPIPQAQTSSTFATTSQPVQQPKLQSFPASQSYTKPAAIGSTGGVKVSQLLS